MNTPTPIECTQEEYALLVLACTDGIGPILARSLIGALGSAHRVISAQRYDLERVPGIGKKLIELLLSEKARTLALEELSHLRKHPEIYPLFYTSDEYPENLRHCPDAPLVLYVRGVVPLDGPLISIVGTRRMTSYTTEVLDYFLRELSAIVPSAVIVSGLAYGVDITAHELALKHGLRSVGVVAHGHHMLYPASHKNVAAEMVARGGGVVTEYTFCTRAHPQRFVARNRIVAGLSLATIVTESPLRGGALITAHRAFEYDRAVFAVPGRYFDENAQGCHSLIAQQKASVLTTVDKFLSDCNLIKEPPCVQALPLDFSGSYDDPILRLLSEVGDLTVEDISCRLGESLTCVSTQLFELELEGRVRSLPGSRYALEH